MKLRYFTLFFLMIGCGFASLCGCKRSAPAPTWNLAPVIGQPIDVARKTLGEPQSEIEVTPGITQSTWRSGDATLSAQWKSSNGRVTAWNLISRDDSSALRDGETAPLLLAGQLKENDARYSTEWIESSAKPLFYTGVKIVPAPKTHAVVLRLSGSQAMLQVNYQVNAPGGKSDNFMTFAPWEASFSVPDDASVSLSTDIYKVLDRSVFQMKVEIIADGKVVASDSSTGRGVRCSYEF